MSHVCFDRSEYWDESLMFWHKWILRWVTRREYGPPLNIYRDESRMFWHKWRIHVSPLTCKHTWLIHAWSCHVTWCIHVCSTTYSYESTYQNTHLEVFLLIRTWWEFVEIWEDWFMRDMAFSRTTRFLCDVTYLSVDMTHSRSYLAESIHISSWE